MARAVFHQFYQLFTFLPHLYKQPSSKWPLKPFRHLSQGWKQEKLDPKTFLKVALQVTSMNEFQTVVRTNERFRDTLNVAVIEQQANKNFISDSKSIQKSKIFVRLRLYV